jgi:hypothetical protein
VWKSPLTSHAHCARSTEHKGKVEHPPDLDGCAVLQASGLVAPRVYGTDHGVIEPASDKGQERVGRRASGLRFRSVGFVAVIMRHTSHTAMAS